MAAFEVTTEDNLRAVASRARPRPLFPDTDERSLDQSSNYGQSDPSTFQWSEPPPAVVQRRPTLMKFSLENYSADVNIHSGPTCFFHPFSPGINIYVASESLFTSSRNDYSRAPESAVWRIQIQTLFQAGRISGPNSALINASNSFDPTSGSEADRPESVALDSR
jgi:hypothetical protein